MLGPILDVAIGLVFTFLLFSILVSAVTEAVASAFKLRARALEDAFLQLIENPAAPKGLIDNFIRLFWKAKRETPGLPEGALSYTAVYCHPLVGGAQGHSPPSYVPPEQFASALMAVLRGAASGQFAADVAAGVAALPPGKFQEALTAIVGETQGQLDALKKGIEDWFNAAMDRLSGDYKRFAQLFAFGIGFVLAISMNIDTVHIAHRLYNEPVLRQAMAEAAGNFIRDNKPAGQTPCASIPQLNAADVSPCKAAIDKAASMLLVTVPAGWAPEANSVGTFGGWVWRISGWILTALAGMVGSAYWFQLLTLLINLRGTGPKPEGKKDGK